MNTHPIDCFKATAHSDKLQAANEGDLTEADLLEIDRQYSAAKSDGSLTRSRDERALKSQIERQGAAR